MTIEELLSHSKKQYIAKIGNTFLVSPASKDIAESMSREELDKRFVEFPSEMIKCLNNTPNVVSCSRNMAPELIGSLYVEEERNREEGISVYDVSGFVPNFFDCIKFQAIWPRKNQEIPAWYSGEVLETFNILYDGAIFLVFGETSSIGDRWYAWQFGLEAMKIIKSCFEQSELWQVTKIGPIMLHPAIYFTFVDDEVELSSPTAMASDNDLYVFFPFQNGGAPEEHIEEFFYSVGHAIKEHHGNLLLRHEIMTTEIDFRSKFQTLSLAHQNLLALSSWNPRDMIKRSANLRQLREGIRQAYEIYVTLMDLHAAMTQERRQFKAQVLQNTFLREMWNYFDELVSDVAKTDFSPLLQGVRFFEEETRTVTTGRSNLQAALVGALVASVIYAIASALVA